MFHSVLWGEPHKKYKDDGDEDFYTARYQEEVLSFLDPKKVVKDLGPESILLCWERPDRFCHRHIVAEWLRKAGYDVWEL